MPPQGARADGRRRLPFAAYFLRKVGRNLSRTVRAGIDSDGPHTLHRLRGTFATEVLKASGDLRNLQAMLGHANLVVTSVYLSEVDEHKRSAVRDRQSQNYSTHDSRRRAVAGLDRLLPAG